ncbi:MAG: hypothetical protein EXR27_06750 [Betaproteobacteria bacterium]|nr:hypothetical protein [Betaproteobacteria bacterium]
MTDIAERINNPVSTAELERRWAAVRAAMAEHKVDVLLMQANNDFMGGYVKYFTDIPATNGYVQTVIFPRDDRMTVIGQGPFGLDRQLAEGDPLRRGVARHMGTPSYASVPYSAGYDGALAEMAMARYAGAKVGMLGTAAISYALIDHLKRGILSGANFVDASDMVERPLVRFDEPMAIGASMYFALHPAYVTERTYSWTCDNFLLNAQGAIEKLHRMPQKIFELG